MMRRWLAIGNLLALLLAGRAEGQASTGAVRANHEIVLELGVGWDRQPSVLGERWFSRLVHPGGPTPPSSRAVLSSGASAHIRLLGPRPGARGLVADLDLAARVLNFRNASSLWMVRAGDPYVGLRAGHRTGGLLVRGGLGLTLPFGALGDGPHEAERYERVGRRTFGLWEPWLLWPGTLCIVLRGDLALDEGWITTGVELALAIAIPVADPPGLYAAIAQIGAWIGLRLGIVDVGLRGNWSSIMSQPWNDDGTQAVGPFLRLRPHPLRVEARALFTPLYSGTIPEVAAQALVGADWN